MFAEIQRNLRCFSMKSHCFASFLNVRIFKKTKAFEISIFSIVYNNENDVDCYGYCHNECDVKMMDWMMPNFVGEARYIRAH